MYAIPTTGRCVPLPGTRHFLPESGQNIGPMTQYWQRRLHDGDITVSDAAPAATATISAPAATPIPAATSALDSTKSTS